MALFRNLTVVSDGEERRMTLSSDFNSAVTLDEAGISIYCRSSRPIADFTYMPADRCSLDSALQHWTIRT